MNDWYYRILRDAGRQVDQRLLKVMANALNVRIGDKMHTAEMAATIVQDSYGRPSSSEQRGLSRISSIIRSDLESDAGNPSGQDREDVYNALAWLARGGKIHEQ